MSHTDDTPARANAPRARGVEAAVVHSLEPPPLEGTLDEARRIMRICNACRYCEGFCAVFPAMELRRTFSGSDLVYLANLCHDCRGCYYACQYAPPHEFAVSVPRTLAAVRADSYAELAWPVAAARLVRRNGPAVVWITAASIAVVALLTVILQAPSAWWATHLGAGAFYEVIPYGAMVVPASVIGSFALVALAAGALRFWRESGGTWKELAAPGGLASAGWDALRLRYLDGGGPGCTYPDDAASRDRKWLHHLVVWGFALDLAATTAAAFYHHALHLEAPYPLSSLPVALGTVGGAALLVGSGGLLRLKRRADPEPAEARMIEMDVAFLRLLCLTSLTGLALLVLRETVLMGALLALHLGAVAGLFLTLPYGKLAHAGYRYLALVRYARERGKPEPRATR